MKWIKCINYLKWTCVFETHDYKKWIIILSEIWIFFKYWQWNKKICKFKTLFYIKLTLSLDLFAKKNYFLDKFLKKWLENYRLIIS